MPPGWCRSGCCAPPGARPPRLLNPPAAEWRRSAVVESTHRASHLQQPVSRGEVQLPWIGLLVAFEVVTGARVAEP
eukprot:9369331-Alexandrium_andersonii.AAC.1